MDVYTSELGALYTGDPSWFAWHSSTLPTRKRERVVSGLGTLQLNLSLHLKNTNQVTSTAVHRTGGAFCPLVSQQREPKQTHFDTGEGRTRPRPQEQRCGAASASCSLTLLLPKLLPTPKPGSTHPPSPPSAASSAPGPGWDEAPAALQEMHGSIPSQTLHLHIAPRATKASLTLWTQWFSLRGMHKYICASIFKTRYKIKHFCGFCCCSSKGIEIKATTKSI